MLDPSALLAVTRLHGRMKSVCGSLNVQTLGRTVQQQLGRTAVSQDMRNFAEAFVA